MTRRAASGKPKSLGSGGSMVAKLKLKGIDGRAPPGVEPISQWACSFNTLEPLKKGGTVTQTASRGSPEHEASKPKTAVELPETLDCSHIHTDPPEHRVFPECSLFPPPDLLSPADSASTGQRSDSAAELPAASLTLSLSPTLSPEEFERRWLQRCSLRSEEAAEESNDFLQTEDRIYCSAVLQRSPQTLQAAMQLVNIQTLAFTPPSTLPWRVFFYTHTAGTPASTLILGELLYAGEADPTPKDEEEEERKADGEAAAEELTGREDRQVEVKVTLKQQPKDEEAVRAFLSVLSTVLHTLSSERHDEHAATHV